MQLYYHYTSLDTLLKIVAGAKWRFTNIGFMNDGNEFHYAWELAKEFVPELEGITLRNQLLPCWVTFFSIHDDSFSQWGMYGDSGKGVAVGVEVQNIQFSLSRPTKPDGSTFLFDQKDIVYLPDDQKTKLAAAIQEAEAYAEFESIEEIGAKKLLAISEHAVFFKQPQFASEQEVRCYQFFPVVEFDDDIIEPKDYASYAAKLCGQLNFANRSGILVPYLDLAILDPTFIKRIVVGPRFPKGGNIRMLQQFLSMYGLRDVEVDESKIVSGL
jgi:Protein of unknown function (DUF2971)